MTPMTTMSTFLVVWLGQMVSAIGTQLTGFGLGVWLYQRTGSVTLYGLVSLAAVLPQLLATPLAGVLADRRDRRVVLIVSHALAGACSLAIAMLFHCDRLTVATIIPLVMLASAFNAAQVPTFGASVTLLVPPRQLGRANGMVQLGAAVAQIVAPGIAGVLLPRIRLSGILIIDVASFIFAIVVLALVRFPRPAASAEGRAARSSTLAEIAVGWRFIRARRGLVGLVLLFGAVNFNLGMVQVLFAPLVLGFADAATLGTIASVGGVGMAAGGILMVAWGGPRRRVHGVLAFVLMQGLLLLLGGAHPSALLAGAGAFGVLFTMPLIAGLNQAIWQRKVPADVQGRVFAFRALLTMSCMPLACLVAGPLADRVFEPAMAAGGWLAPTLGRVIGVGRGRGVALLFVVMGCVTSASVLVAWLQPRLRRVERELPDYEPISPVAVS
jgi:MFS family permease